MYRKQIITSFLFLFILSFSLNSCGPSEEKLEEQLYEEVMAIHDEVMPRMGEVQKIRSNLQEARKTMLLGSNSVPAEQVNTISQEISLLEKADDDMMTWMRNFNTEYDSLSHEETMQYLGKEKATVQAVNNIIKESIAKGNARLELLK